MPFSLTTRRVRLQSDFPQDGSIIDRLTGQQIEIPLASDIRFEIGIFVGLLGSAPSSDSQVISTTGWESLTLTLQQQRGANVVSKTVAAFAALTASTWNDDSAQHCVIDLTDAETNIPPRLYRLALTVQSSTFGPYPVGTADIRVFDPHNLNSSNPADANPGAPISRDAADARFVRLSLADVAGDLFYASADNVWARLPKGNNGEVLTMTAGLPAWAPAGGGTIDNLLITTAQMTALNLTVANEGTQRLVYGAVNAAGTILGTGFFRFRQGTDATAVPNIYRPDNYAGLATKMVWERVL